MKEWHGISFHTPKFQGRPILEVVAIMWECEKWLCQYVGAEEEDWFWKNNGSACGYLYIKNLEDTVAFKLRFSL